MSALKSDLQIAPQEIYANSVTTQPADLGARVTAGDGRVFRLVGVGSTTALVAGKVYQAAPQDVPNLQNLGVAATAGTLGFTVTTASGTTITLVANQLAGGLLTVRSGSGLGFGYKIKSHPAITAGTVTFTLEDPLQINCVSSAIDLIPSPYANVVVAVGQSINSIPVGVAVQNGTATGYAWVQTRGVCNVLSDGAITVGRSATPSTVVAGALMAATTGTMPCVAYSAMTTKDTAYNPFFLTFE